MIEPHILCIKSIGDSPKGNFLKKLEQIGLKLESFHRPYCGLSFDYIFQKKTNEYNVFNKDEATIASVEVCMTKSWGQKVPVSVLTLVMPHPDDMNHTVTVNK